MSHEGNLTIWTKEDAEKYAGLKSVSGNLYIHADVKLDALTSVGGYLTITADAKLDALTSVGGYQLPTNAEAGKNLRILAPLALRDGALEMGDWHCGSSHCIAGWAQHHLAGVCDRETASIDGTRFLGLEATRHFHVSDEKAREFLRQYVD